MIVIMLALYGAGYAIEDSGVVLGLYESIILGSTGLFLLYNLAVETFDEALDYSKKEEYESDLKRVKGVMILFKILLIISWLEMFFVKLKEFGVL